MGIDRKDIDAKYKWKIDLMYSSQESIDKDISKIKSYINEIKEYKGKLSQSKENMYEALNIYEKASQLLQNLYVYTHMKQHEDTRINENQAMATKTDMLSTELSTASSYMVPEIIAIDESKLKEYLEDEKLSFYKKYIEEILREKPHTLSEKEEEILAAVSDLTSVPENAYDMLSYADMDFPKIENEDGEMVKLTHSNFSTFLKSKNNKVRKEKNLWTQNEEGSKITYYKAFDEKDESNYVVNEIKKLMIQKLGVNFGSIRLCFMRERYGRFYVYVQNKSKKQKSLKIFENKNDAEKLVEDVRNYIKKDFI